MVFVPKKKVNAKIVPKDTQASPAPEHRKSVTCPKDTGAGAISMLRWFLFSLLTIFGEFLCLKKAETKSVFECVSSCFGVRNEVFILFRSS